MPGARGDASLDAVQLNRRRTERPLSRAASGTLTSMAATAAVSREGCSLAQRCPSPGEAMVKP